LIKPRRMGWTRHAAPMEEIRNIGCREFKSVNLNGTDSLGEQGVYGRIILKSILRTIYGCVPD
jgi:hypothetical protein